MKYQKMTIEVLVASQDYGDSHDIMVETMRSQLRRYNPQSRVIDWRFASNGEPEPHSGEGFAYTEDT